MAKEEPACERRLLLVIDHSEATETRFQALIAEVSPVTNRLQR